MVLNSSTLLQLPTTQIPSSDVQRRLQLHKHVLTFELGTCVCVWNQNPIWADGMCSCLWLSKNHKRLIERYLSLTDLGDHGGTSRLVSHTLGRAVSNLEELRKYMYMEYILHCRPSDTAYNRETTVFYIFYVLESRSSPLQ